MSRVIRTVIGLAMVAGGLLFAFWALYDLVQFGSCASGGPYVSARPCPAGTGAKIVGLVGSIFAVLIGAALTASGRVALATWGLGFSGLGATFALATLGPSAPEGASTAMGLIMGGVFGTMGVPALLMAMAGRSRAKRRAVRIAGPTGAVEVRAPEDGGPAPIVSAAVPPNPDA